MKKNDWKSEDIWVNYCFLPDNVVSLPNRNLRSKTLNVGSTTLNGGSTTLNVGSTSLNGDFSWDEILLFLSRKILLLSRDHISQR